MTKHAKFDGCTKTDYKLIIKIIARAAGRGFASVRTQDDEMDLVACHSSGCPLDFKNLLEFDDADFGHDFNSIRRHINRTTGELENWFHPRCARSE